MSVMLESDSNGEKMVFYLIELYSYAFLLLQQNLQYFISCQLSNKKGKMHDPDWLIPFLIRQLVTNKMCLNKLRDAFI